MHCGLGRSVDGSGGSVREQMEHGPATRGTLLDNQRHCFLQHLKLGLPM